MVFNLFNFAPLFCFSRTKPASFMQTNEIKHVMPARELVSIWSIVQSEGQLSVFFFKLV